MTMRERDHRERETARPPALPGAGADLRGSAERLLAEGGDAIDRALSEDSAAFLAANRQEGGQ